jgi:peptidoglycan/LPS O-acetylase OafA/YrhL
MWLGRAMHLPVESQTDELSKHGLLYVSPLARLFEFVTGMVAYLAFQQIQTVARKINDVAFTFLESAIVIIAGYSIVSYAIPMFLMEYLPVTGMQWLWSTSDVLIFPLVVIVFAFGRGGLSHLLGSSPMILLGEISFSIYLVHGTIFWFYWKHAQIDAAPDYWGLAICVATTLALAFMIWAFIEMPSRNAAKRWLKKASTSFVQAEACILR